MNLVFSGLVILTFCVPSNMGFFDTSCATCLSVDVSRSRAGVLSVSLIVVYRFLLISPFSFFNYVVEQCSNFKFYCGLRFPSFPVRSQSTETGK
uniref:Secreted protein n=1 Tax=Panstrongylus lignarius TaxID=156445 RepID=A0A224XRA8_9HEMI